MLTTMKFTHVGENRMSALTRSQRPNQQILSRNSSRLSFQDEFDDSEFSYPFDVDDDDLTDPGESRMSALAKSQSPNQQILNRYDGDSTIGHRLYKEIPKVEFVKMKGR
ncbi:hypothetical protein GIB67_005804 [Kingdonia uniflora]|uniref:Uncharacterized protein n=1 Tax=Kingdonia uniflora TaxID=39325 RepID=A0A7J7MBM5_9MAGN|nr:hypothetical protein GIB67_005804 [Kingdonia uniflora]